MAHHKASHARGRVSSPFAFPLPSLPVAAASLGAWDFAYPDPLHGLAGQKQDASFYTSISALHLSPLPSPLPPLPHLLDQPLGSPQCVERSTQYPSYHLYFRRTHPSDRELKDRGALRRQAREL